MSVFMTVSCVADDEFKLRLAMLAKKKRQHAGTLVRQALDEMFGNELAELDISFFTESGASEHQKNATKPEAESA